MKRLSANSALCRATLCSTFVVAAACANDNTESSSDGSGGGTPDCVTLADGSCVVETFSNPPVLEPDADGVYQLTLGPAEVVLDGERHCVRAYNGSYPGPTIETAARAGAAERQVRVNLFNRFTQSDFGPLNDDVCTCADETTGQSCLPEGHATDADPHGTGSCRCTNQDGAVCHLFDFNVTNLHAHGAHVSPDFATGRGCVEQGPLRCRACSEDGTGPAECFHGDDVLSVARPGYGRQHRWDIDEGETHHDGLQWYHPHIHGTTAMQLVSGAAGAWIVRGPVDDLPGIKEARERVIVFSAAPLDNNGYEPLAEGVACTEDTLTFNNFAALSDASALQTNLINGQRRPRMILPPGQIERWRFVDAAYLDEVFLALLPGDDSNCSSWDSTRPFALTQIARDGMTLTRPPDGLEWPWAPPYTFLSPGYRIDAILDGGQLQHGDTLCMVAVRFLQQVDSPVTDGPVGITGTISDAIIRQRFTAGDLVAIVNVSDDAGPPTETRLPDYAAVAALAPRLELDGGSDVLTECQEAAVRRELDTIDQVVAFQIGASLEGPDNCGCSDHNINCTNFERADRELYPLDRVLELGDVQHWRVFSAFDGHPFHIHINPYFVCPLPPEGSPEPNALGRLFEPPWGHWRDTYLVNLARYADLITQYRSHTGRFVFHCHKLTHEDHGMMELMTVCDPTQTDCDALCDGRPCGWNHCAPDDTQCERQWFATNCLLTGDCAAAPQWCTECDGTLGSCPPGSTCSDQETWDGTPRCVPGCGSDDECAVSDACIDGACVAAPCDAPCPPPQVCAHGECVDP